MMIEIRKEYPSEYHEVENIVREAFWNVYRPGCAEHLILHQFRQHPNYLENLSKVILVDGQLAGQIMFSKAQLRHEQTGQVKEIATFGPFAILPVFQKQGFGEKLAQAAIRQAREEGFSHIVLFGNPAYYPKYGFVTASDYGIYLDGQDKEEILDFVMALDLQRDGSVTRENGPWLYRDPEGYEVDEAELEVFDRKFPPKKKEKLPGQLG